MAVIAGSAPYGVGGLGQHLLQLVETTRARGYLERYFSPEPKPNDSSGEPIDMRIPRFLCQYGPARFSQASRTALYSDWFDRVVADRLPKATLFNGFASQGLRSLHRAQALRYKELALDSATSHVSNVMRQHEQAQRAWGIEEGWLNDRLASQTIKEFQLADYVYVTSRYSHDSFISEGVPEGKLRRRRLKVDPRFREAKRKRPGDRFRVVYAGGLTVVKGIPVLLEAFSRLKSRDAELLLVGGWSTRGMRRYLQAWLRRDSRVRIVHGDPLPLLQIASVYVHPSYQDGFGLAPMEALSCGVPVIVSSDTGMKERVTDGVNGYVVPTGDWKTLLERLETVEDKPLTITDAITA